MKQIKDINIDKNQNKSLMNFVLKNSNNIICFINKTVYIKIMKYKMNLMFIKKKYNQITAINKFMIKSINLFH